MMIRFEKEILEAYERLGFSPRGNQVEAISSILVAYIDDKIENVLLSAPTGTGKSIIGVVVGEVLNVLTAWPMNGHTVIAMGTNVLAEQYYNTFNGNKDFLVVKGANNYDCSVTQDTAETCVSRQLQSQGMTDLVDEHCSHCKYHYMKSRRDFVRHLITNYSFVFVERMYIQKMETRNLMVWDEAHTLNDAFVEHNAIYVSVERLDKILTELSASLPTSNVDIFKKIKKIKKALEAGLFNEDTYASNLNELHEAYEAAAKAFADKMGSCIKKGMKNFDTYKKFSRLYKKYFGLGCKIDDLFKYNYEHVVDYKEKEQEISVKPIFVGEMFNALKNSNYSLFMSATLNPSFMIKTLNLNKEKTRFIQLDPSFSPENKKLVFYSPLSLSYKTMKDPKVVQQLLTNCSTIFSNHNQTGDRGIFLTPSFDLSAKIADKLRVVKPKDVTIFEQQRGQKLVDILSQFKNHDGKAVLISPAMFEGIDLPGDQSRYQVLVKAPYPSLGDKRMAHILERYPELYEILTIMKVVQGAGRSVRSPDDWATTYVLDTNIKRLFNSNNNVWKNEFAVSYKNLM